MSTPPPQMIAYYRVSTQMQGSDGLGIAAQRTAVEQYAARVGATIAAEVVEVESGRNCARPQLAAALVRAKAEGATLVVAKLDRLARDVRFILEIADSGTPFVCLDLPDIDPTTSAGRMLLIGLANFAEFEARRIAERCRAAAAARRARLVREGTLEQYLVRQRGYADKGRASFLAAAQKRRAALYPILRELRDRPMTYEAIATRMNSRRILTPQGKRWTAGLVHNVLKRGDML